MTVRSSRSAILATLLALLAVFGMGALSGWHGATFHDDDPVHAASVQHVHLDPDAARGDPDRDVHLGAHAVGHGVGLPVNPLPLAPVPVARMAWTAGVPAMLWEHGPGSLLRPPRG